MKIHSLLCVRFYSTGVTARPDSIVYTVANYCDTAAATFGIIVDSGTACIPVSVAVALATPSELLIYPNPTQGDFTVFVSSDMEEQAIVKVLDMLGQQVLDFTVSTNQETTIKNQLRAGIYLLSVNTVHTVSCVKLLVTK